VLAIDDAPGPDSPSVRWLLLLARRLEGLPLLVAVAMRRRAGARPRALTELLTDPAATAIRPEPLTVASIASLARRRFEDEADAEFCAAVEAATRGNRCSCSRSSTRSPREASRLAPTRRTCCSSSACSSSAARSRSGSRGSRGRDRAAEAAAILGDGTELRQASALAGSSRRRRHARRSELVAPTS
jgi:hypothetical protein